jgi:hypothetical protein
MDEAAIIVRAERSTTQGSGSCAPRADGVTIGLIPAPKGRYVTALAASIDATLAALERRLSAFALRTAALRLVQLQRQGVLRPGQIAALHRLSNLADRLRERPLGSAKLWSWLSDE